MSWLSPTGHEDPDEGWTDEENAYDEDNESVASSSTLPTHAWSKFLILTISAIVASKLRFDAQYIMVLIATVDVDVSEDGVDWTDVYEGAFADHEWVEKEFTEQTVTKVRIRFRNNDMVSYAATLYEFDFYGAPAVAVNNLIICKPLISRSIAGVALIK